MGRGWWFAFAPGSLWYWLVFGPVPPANHPRIYRETKPGKTAK